MSAGDFEKALLLIDEAHSRDPNLTSEGSIPYELHYANRMSHWLCLRSPSSGQNASEQTSASKALQLAIRGQHFRRWEIPRTEYPDGKLGYYKWRTELKKRQAQQIEDLLIHDCGFTAEYANEVGALIRKDGLRPNPQAADTDVQILEDVACLVFLEDQFDDFQKKHDEDKLVTILRKTWAKMSPKGRDLALTMQMEGRPKELVEKALSADSTA